MKDTLRILMTTDVIGGVWHYAAELCRALSARGHHIHLVAFPKSPTNQQLCLLPDCPRVTISSAPYKLEWMKDPWRDIDAAGKRLLDLERSFHPDIVHLNSFSLASLPFEAPTLVVGHSCVYSWFRAVRSDIPGPEWWPYRDRVEHGLVSADLVTAPSQSMLDSLHAEYGSFRTLGPIPNGVTTELFSQGEKRRFFLAAGRFWDEAKNLQLLDQIAPHLPWPCLVAGSLHNPAGARVSAQAVCTLGIVPPQELRQWYAQAPIYLSPALYEPFGLTVLEAALSGAALILSDIPSFRELWQGAALFVPPTEAAWVSAARMVVENPLLRARLAADARRRANKFNSSLMGERYEQQYFALCGRPKRLQARSNELSAAWR
ncbi:MAG: glycosyltransferase family 4 protein [Bdellovibrionales bacterium]|nr:glycosyltransferase family 4 protein [Bdellovibrionales bacterium]